MQTQRIERALQTPFQDLLVKHGGQFGEQPVPVSLQSQLQFGEHRALRAEEKMLQKKDARKGVESRGAARAYQHSMKWPGKWFDVSDLDIEEGDLFPVDVSESRLDVVARQSSRAYFDKPLPWSDDVRLTLRLEQASEGGATAVGIAYCSSTPHLRPRAKRSEALPEQDSRLGRASDSVALVSYSCFNGDIEAHGAKHQLAVCGRVEEHTEFTIEWRGTSQTVTFLLDHTPVGLHVKVQRGEDYVFAVGLKPGHRMKIVDCHIIDETAEMFAPP